jgi:sulfur carrier protein ThiS
LYHARPDVLVQIVNDQAEELKNPPLSVTDVLDTLAQHAPTVVRLLREAIAAREDVVDQQ